MEAVISELVSARLFPVLRENTAKCAAMAQIADVKFVGAATLPAAEFPAGEFLEVLPTQVACTSQIAPPPPPAASPQLSEPAAERIEQDEHQKPDKIDARKT